MSALSKAIPDYLSKCIVILFFSIICSYYFVQLEMSHVVICDSGSCSKTCPIVATSHSLGTDYVWRSKLNSTIHSVAISHWNCFTTLFIPCTLFAHFIDFSQIFLIDTVLETVPQNCFFAWVRTSLSPPVRKAEVQPWSPLFHASFLCVDYIYWPHRLLVVRKFSKFVGFLVWVFFFPKSFLAYYMTYLY